MEDGGWRMEDRGWRVEGYCRKHTHRPIKTAPHAMCEVEHSKCACLTRGWTDIS